jgi:hypothetical protein
VKTVNIDKTDLLSVQNSKNEFKQNRTNQNDRSNGFFDLSIGFVLQNDLSLGFLTYQSIFVDLSIFNFFFKIFGFSLPKAGHPMKLDRFCQKPQ